MERSTLDLWVGLFVPKGTPAAAIATLSAAADKAAGGPQFSEAIAKIGMEPTYLGTAAFTKFWDDDSNRSAEAVRQIGKVEG